MSDPASGAGPAEAARWVQDALASAREWFPDLPEHELRAPLEQAFELASATGRGEREFHAVFETELRRALEERAVIGSTGSVLPGQSPTARKPFQAVAAGSDEGPGAEPAGDDPAENEPDHDRARAFGLAVGALRFHDGLSPKEIRDEHGIEADYYSEIMQWLLHEVDRTLDGDYPAHLDRQRMAGFAAGLEDIHASFEVDRHVRECSGCAIYLADLLEGAVQLAEPGSVDPVVNGPTTHRRRRRRAPAMSVKAAELRRYARQVTPSAPDVSAEYPDDPAPRRAQIRKPGRRAGVVAAVALAAVAVAVAVLAAGGDEPAPGPTAASQRARAEGAARKADRERALRQSERATKRAAAKRREARERRAASRRRDAQQSTPRTRAPAPVNPPERSRPPAASSPPVAPAPSSPAPAQPNPPQGEFGLEP